MFPRRRRQAGGGFRRCPKWRVALAYGDFDRDGDLDLLITTNQGPALLYRNDVTNGNRSLRLRLTGTKSNRDAIGAMVRVTTPDGTQSRMVKTGSSYLSQSELALDLRPGQARKRGPRGDRVAQRTCRSSRTSKPAHLCTEGRLLRPR